MPTCHESNSLKALSKLPGAILAVLAYALLVACGPVAEPPAERADAETYFPIGLGDRTLHLQLALTPAEQQKGLMLREHGKLFISEHPRQQAYWMKDTSLPLDIGFFDARGRLKEVHKLYPYDETTVSSHSDQILIAVETNTGWYANNGIGPGAQLDISALASAIAKRGFPASAFLTTTD